MGSGRFDRPEDRRCTPTTLLDWVERTEIDSGVRPGVTSEEREEWRTTRGSPKTKRLTENCQASVLVETRRIELPTFALRTRRSPS